MRDDMQDQTGERQEFRAALRELLFPVFLVLAFALCYLSAFHNPTPQDVKVAVVGPASQTLPLRDSFQRAAGQAFDVSAVTTPDEASREVGDRELYGAYIPPAGPNQPATLLAPTRRGTRWRAW